MGDRGNIAMIRDGGKEQVWLYSHWGGYHLPEDVRIALARNERWDDYSYLNRIIICQAIDKQSWDETTGIGIASSIGDNEYPITVVNHDNQTVYSIAESELEDGRVPVGYEPKESRTFEEYAKQPALKED